MLDPCTCVCTDSLTAMLALFQQRREMWIKERDRYKGQQGSLSHTQPQRGAGVRLCAQPRPNKSRRALITQHGISPAPEQPNKDSHTPGHTAPSTRSGQHRTAPAVACRLTHRLVARHAWQHPAPTRPAGLARPCHCRSLHCDAATGLVTIPVWQPHVGRVAAIGGQQDNAGAIATQPGDPITPTRCSTAILPTTDGPLTLGIVQACRLVCLRHSAVITPQVGGAAATLATGQTGSV
jgi:hypothetical protein